MNFLNLREYIPKDLEFIESKYDYQVEILGDIKICFNHSKTQEETKLEY